MISTIYFLYHDPEGYGVAKTDGERAVSVGGPYCLDATEYPRLATYLTRIALDADRQAEYGTWPPEHQRMEAEYRAQLHADHPLPRDCWIERRNRTLEAEHLANLKADAADYPDCYEKASMPLAEAESDQQQSPPTEPFVIEPYPAAGEE